RYVVPVSAPLADERLRVIGPELQSGGAFAVGTIPASRAFSLAANPQPESDARGVAKPLRLVVAVARQVVDLGESQVPERVPIGHLRELPQPLHAAANTDL